MSLHGSSHRPGLALAFVVGSLALARPSLARADAPEPAPTPPPTWSAGAAAYAPTWGYEGVYFAMGTAPATTLHRDGFNPGLRYDAELGLHWRRGRTTVFVGADTRLHQVFGRTRPGGGVDGMITVSHGPVYGRVGAGVMTGIPGSIDPNDARPAMGGLVGLGLQGGGKHVVGRIGVDYDVRLDTGLRVNQTVLLSLRFVFGF